MTTSNPLAQANDPIVVRQIKWLLEKLATILFVSWLRPLRERYPQTTRYVNGTPNGMGRLRGLTIPFLCILLYLAITSPTHHNLSLAVSLVIINVFMDGLDGPVARQLKAESEKGRRLDANYDKFTLLCLGATLLCLLDARRVDHIWAFAIIFSVLMTVESFLVIIRKLPSPTEPLRPGVKLGAANSWGKYKYFVEITALSIGIIGQIIAPTNADWVVASITVLLLALMFAVMSLARHWADRQPFPVQPLEVTK